MLNVNESLLPVLSITKLLFNLSEYNLHIANHVKHSCIHLIYKMPTAERIGSVVNEVTSLD